MARWISPDLRQRIAARANLLCEYFLVAEADTFYGCEVDHIISLKHGGSSETDNLAYACALCNCAKGSDVGSVSTSGEFTPFFHPRTDRWAEHFRLEQAAIRIENLKPQSAIPQSLSFQHLKTLEKLLKKLG